MELPDLDAEYGVLVPPRYSLAEGVLRPASLLKLEQDTAGFLRDLFAPAASGYALSDMLFSEIPMLWVVDRVGDIYVALEEIVDGVGIELPFPKPARCPVPTGMFRIGHPTLVACQPARIGGEIAFDPGLDPPAWVLSNKSGRFGINLGRTRDQLENVATRFSDLGVHLVTSFL